MNTSTINNDRSVLAAAAVGIFRPLVKVLLRFGVSYKTCAEWLRWSYVDVAARDFKLQGRKQTKSRMAVLTGLSRVEVDRMLKTQSPELKVGEEQYHRAARVLTGWAYDKAYLDGHGRPAVIPIEGAEPSFAALVNRYSGGAPARAVLDELQRVGSVDVTPERRVRLVKANFVPGEQAAQIDQLKIMGFSVSRLLETVEYNLDPSTEQTRLQLMAFSRRLPAEHMQAVRDRLHERGREVIEEVDQFLFEHSGTDDPDEEGELLQAGLGIYFYEDTVE